MFYRDLEEEKRFWTPYQYATMTNMVKEQDANRFINVLYTVFERLMLPTFDVRYIQFLFLYYTIIFIYALCINR